MFQASWMLIIVSSTSITTLNNGLDQHLRMLCQKGKGLERKRATLITEEHKDQLWRVGVMGNHSPSALLNAFFLQWQMFPS